MVTGESPANRGNTLNDNFSSTFVNFCVTTGATTCAAGVVAVVVVVLEADDESCAFSVVLCFSDFLIFFDSLQVITRLKQLTFLLFYLHASSFSHLTLMSWQVLVLEKQWLMPMM